MRANSDSSKPGSVNAIEQVLTGSADSPAIIATTALESTPPERNAPSGTSEIMRSRTDSRSRATSSSAASCSVSVRVEREADVPVLARLGQRRAALHAERVRRRELQRAAEDRARLGDVAEREVLLDRERVDRRVRGAGCTSSALQLRAEHELAVRQERVEERLDAEAVAREEQRLAVPVPEREGEHAAEARRRTPRPTPPRRGR